jgi:hypothetical protein
MTDTVTQADVDELNQRAVERTAIIVRLTGGALVFVACFIALCWVWSAARIQQQIGPYGFDLGGDLDGGGPSLKERFDLFAGTINTLAFAAIVAGTGMLLRLAGDFAQARIGGSITGYREGDSIPDDEEEADLD